MQNDNCFAELTKRRECKHRTNAKGVNNVTVCCSKMAKLFERRKYIDWRTVSCHNTQKQSNCT